MFALAVLGLVLVMNLALALTWCLVWPLGAGYPTYFFSVNTGLILLFVLGGCGLKPQAWAAQLKNSHDVPAHGSCGRPPARPSSACTT